jgi:hypothetical protein
MLSSITVWIMLVLIPLFPVISLYQLFQNQNFFQLDGVPKGLVASGPVAAYVVFVYVGWKIFEQVSRQRNFELGVAPSQQLADQLVGNWDFTSRSSVHKRELTGEARIRFNNGVLRLNGVFQENRTPIGNWTSESAQVVDSSVLVVVYDMEEIKNGEFQKYRGVCTFQLSTSPITEMIGFWVVVGRAEMYGIVEYKKRAVS